MLNYNNNASYKHQEKTTSKKRLLAAWLPIAGRHTAFPSTEDLSPFAANEIIEQIQDDKGCRRHASVAYHEAQSAKLQAGLINEEKHGHHAKRQQQTDQF